MSVALLGGMAGVAALLGVLYESGVRPPWLERVYVNHVLPSDRFAERAYARLLAGDTAGALELFQLGVRRDPASPYRWCDYAEALLTAGERDRAYRCMRRGLELGPSIGPVQMRGVNFFYRTGDPAGALKYGAALLAITDAYDPAIFTVWERMELPIGSILEQGIAGRRPAQAYLRSIMRRASSPPDATTVWSRIGQRGFADDPLADEYAAYLLKWHQAKEAGLAWAAYAGNREPGYPAANAVFNGSFEREPAGQVFDWQIVPVDGAKAEREAGSGFKGQHALRLSFHHTQNLAYSHVGQKVALQPGNWHFEAYVRTEEITTDEGIGFRVFDMDAPQRLDVRTERLTGTNQWTKLASDFAVPQATQVVEVRVVRAQSLKFDNKLGGTAWIDAVTLCRNAR